MQRIHDNDFTLPDYCCELIAGAPYQAKIKTWRPSPHRFTCMPDYMIVIPAQNEQEKIKLCLDSCANAMRKAKSAGRILLVVNNSHDNTTKLSHKWAEENHIALDILDIEFPKKSASVGFARALGFDMATTILGPRGLLLTTDADTQVDINWVQGHINSAEMGAALTCGKVLVDPLEHSNLPPELIEKSKIEDEYRQLSLTLTSIIDPDPFNPWPHHGDESGANISITSYAYERIGGAPHIACGEDRALVRRVLSRDLPIFYCSQSAVTTSARLQGRAKGGMADTILSRIHDDDYLCDERLESAEMTFRRAKSRYTLRQMMKNEGQCTDLLAQLGLNSMECQQAFRHYTFGAMWNFVEQKSTLFRLERMRFSELKKQFPLLQSLINQHKTPINYKFDVNRKPIPVAVQAPMGLALSA